MFPPLPAWLCGIEAAIPCHPMSELRNLLTQTENATTGPAPVQRCLATTSDGNLPFFAAFPVPPAPGPPGRGRAERETRRATPQARM